MGLGQSSEGATQCRSWNGIKVGDPMPGKTERYISPWKPKGRGYPSRGT